MLTTVRIPSHLQIQSLAHYHVHATLNNLDITRNDSLEWDLEGIELHSSSAEYPWPLDLHQVVNLVPFPPFPVHHHDIALGPLNRDIDLNNELPLSLTPRPYRRLT